jgi:hypothetical protein
MYHILLITSLTIFTEFKTAFFSLFVLVLVRTHSFPNRFRCCTEPTTSKEVHPHRHQRSFNRFRFCVDPV